MLFRTVFICSLFTHVVQSVTLSVTPDTFVPGVTSEVKMRCDVGDSGTGLSQLLLLQLEVLDRGTVVPIVTYTSSAGIKIQEAGTADKVKVEDMNYQPNDITQASLSVAFPFPATQVAGNYTCQLLGLSATGLSVSYTASAVLTQGAAVNELPHFMTASAVELRNLIERIKTQKNNLLVQAQQLRQEEQNITSELALVEQEYGNLANEMSALKSRAGQLPSILNEPIADLDHLSSVRPGMKVAFHAGMSELGARTAVLRVPLVFDHVVTNEGQGYDATSGAFRAPTTGTYLFTVSVEAGSGNRNSELSIMMGDKILQTMHMSDDIDYQHSSTTTIAHVPAGAEVTCEFTWLEGLPGYVGSTQPEAPYVTSFTGYILW